MLYHCIRNIIMIFQLTTTVFFVCDMKMMTMTTTGYIMKDLEYWCTDAKVYDVSVRVVLFYSFFVLYTHSCKNSLSSKCFACLFITKAYYCLIFCKICDNIWGDEMRLVHSQRLLSKYLWDFLSYELYINDRVWRYSSQLLINHHT